MTDKDSEQLADIIEFDPNRKKKETVRDRYNKKKDKLARERANSNRNVTRNYKLIRPSVPSIPPLPDGDNNK